MSLTIDLPGDAQGEGALGREEKWFALQVAPRHEFATARMLRNKGFHEFVPTYRSLRQWSDRKKHVTLPLFTGYVFSKFCPDVKQPIVSIAGVIRIVGSRRGPIPIPEEQLEMTRKASRSGSNVQPHPYIPAGSRVRVIDGPLAGVEGVFHGYDRSELIVSLDIVQRSMRVGIRGCSLAVMDSGVI